MMSHKTLKTVYLDKDGIVKFGLKSGIPEIASGIELLLQNIIIRLFTAFGSNAFNPTIGSDLYSILSSGYKKGQEELLSADFTTAFSKIENQIKEEQSQQADLPYKERLSSIIIESVSFDNTTQTFNIIASIFTEAGSVKTFTIES